ncbi:DNA-directed RNA polymerase [Trypanosoma conorhini]|uniref:DNA-directed RNA polymerase n=1 Tax=Trypanosoma conorhini TaxID=83891 RepID=A0A3R7KT07_9TRYP|nr:DNA-directed RNA polymerase [Trypanosoma conorhini]RNF12934.1 DNA-directed RNA polymerase [Trypanosoma conorhini]
MSGENYVEGDLGPVFSQAEPLTLPVVVQLLRGRRDAGDDAGLESPAMTLIERTREQVELMQETCADEQSVQQVMKMKLRLRDEGETGLANSHLANFILDSEGNVTGMRDPAEDADDHGALKTARMRPFEVVALGTLCPKTVEEALVLVPSLARYEPSDLNLALNTLESL